MNIKKLTILSLVFTVFSIGLLVPLVTIAQMVDPQLTGSGQFVPCSGTNCSACDLVKLANSIVTWLIGIVALMFGVLMIVAGFKLVLSAGNQGALDTAKKMLTNGLIGFLIVLGAWLLVDTLMKALLGDSGELKGYGPWSQIDCWKQNKAVIVEYEEDEAVFIESGGDHGGVATYGTGSNCPAMPKDSVVQIPSSMVSGDAEYLEPGALARFTELHNAAKADGVTIMARDGWRSEEEQVYLYNKYKGKSDVATPCSRKGNGSNHNSGVAVDLVIGCAKTDSSCNSKAYNWMKKNGGKYGFNNALPRDTVHWSPTGK